MLGVAFEGLHRIAQFADVGGVADEGAGDVIRLALHGEREVLVVLFGEGGQVEPHAGQVDVTARTHGAGGFHLAEDAVRLHDIDAHEQRAVVHDEGVADGDIAHQAVIVDGGGYCRRWLGAGLAELDDIALGERDRVPGRSPVRIDGPVRSKSTPMCAAALLRLAADALDHLRGPLVFGVAHVEAEHIGAGVHEVADHVLGLRGGTERADDFGFADIEVGANNGSPLIEGFLGARRR